MKKFITLLLAVTMLLSLAACNTSNDDPNTPTTPSNSTSDTTPDATTPSQPSGDNPSDNPTIPSNPSGSETPDAGYVWETKDVTLPTINTIEIAQYPVVEGWDTQAKLVKSPWQLDDYDIEAVKTAFTNSSLFQDYIFGTELYEKGTMTNYEDVGYRTSYTWEKSVVASAPNNYHKTHVYATDIVIKYTGKSQTIQGYESVSVEINIEDRELTKEFQDEMYELLKVVYGEYAETMCYAPQVDGSILMRVTQNNATITLIRTVNDKKIFLNMYMTPSVRTYHNDYPGTGDYTSIINNLKYTNTILNPKVGDISIADFNNIGSSMLKETYPGYLYTLPEIKPYFMRIMTLDNGHYVEYAKITGNIATEEMSGHLAPDFIMDYTVVKAGEETTRVELDFQCGVGMVGAGDKSDAYYESVRTQFFDTACKMFDYILTDDIDVANVMTKDDSGKHQPYRYNTTIDGLALKASINFDMGYTMAGPIVGYVYYTLSLY